MKGLTWAQGISQDDASPTAICCRGTGLFISAPHPASQIDRQVAVTVPPPHPAVCCFNYILSLNQEIPPSWMKDLPDQWVYCLQKASGREAKQQGKLNKPTDVV